MTYTAPIRRVETAKGHYYKDAHGNRVPGVTTFTDGGLPKKALINWSANATIEYAIDHWDQLGKLTPSARMKKLQGARYEVKDTAARRGTEVHALAEQLLAGEEVEVPDELAGHVESYVQFLDAFQPQPVLVEFAVMSHTYGYAGTGDSILDFPNGLKGFDMPVPRLLCDIKTNRSGIFGETALQLAGYRYADVYLDENGDEQPMIEVDGCAAIHVRGDGCDLIPVIAEQRQHRQFLYAQQIYEFDKEARDLVGAPILPPTKTTRRRLEIVKENAA